MGRAIKAVLLAALIGFGTWWIAALPGRVAADFAGYSFDTSTPVALLALAVLFVVLYILLRLVAAILRLPFLGSRWRMERRRHAGDIAVTRALVAIAAGDANPARREAHKARKLLGDTPQTLLLAAEAARLANRDDEAETAFRALVAMPDAALLGYRGLYRLAVAREAWGEAATLASEAERAHPGANWLRPERSRLAIRAGNWAAALDLSEPGPAKAALTTAAALAEPDPRQAAVRARQAWRLDPALMPAVLVYAGSQRAHGHESVAQSAVRHAWSVAPHPDLATFALAPVTDVLARAKAAQKLAGANPEHAESRLLLARTSLDAGLVGEARHQAEAALASGIDQRRFHLLLADIADAEQRDPEAARVALRHAADGGPDPAWQCDSCHAAYPVWHAACPACATPGSLRWTAG